MQSQPGSLNGGSKLTEEDVQKIRTIYSHGNITQLQLAFQFDVSQNLISLILRRKAWVHC